MKLQLILVCAIISMCSSSSSSTSSSSSISYTTFPSISPATHSSPRSISTRSVSKDSFLANLTTYKPPTHSSPHPVDKPSVSEGSFFANLTIDQMKRLCGSYQFGDPKFERSMKNLIHTIKREEIPESFDARKKWARCKAIKKIRQQGLCGSCWAVSAASVISDRVCIESKGKTQVDLSAEELLRCCIGCHKSNDPCDGGDGHRALKYWTTKGIVTGGEIQTEEGCKPYSKSSFDDDHSMIPCKQECSNPHYNVSYDRDKQYGRSVYRISQAVEQIQTEILLNGPVVACMQVFEDLFTHTSGVYKYRRGADTATEHAVKIIGWGHEDDGPYWLVANSWGTKWGTDGFFRILRGENHCGIEGSIFGASTVNSRAKILDSWTFLNFLFLFLYYMF